jgi:hypothetical protein
MKSEKIAQREEDKRGASILIDVSDDRFPNRKQFPLVSWIAKAKREDCWFPLKRVLSIG